MDTKEIRDWSQNQLVKVREELDRLQKELRPVDRLRAVRREAHAH